MNRQEFVMIENHMLSCMSDSAHDKEHVYRVLYTALDIAQYENNINYDILITACLLHDIGRNEQIENPNLCHAEVGANKARTFLLENGYDINFTEKVAQCIRVHRFRSNNPPKAIEEKVLFDADKIDVTGTLGIARSLLYRGKVEEPLYLIDENGVVSDGTLDEFPSFMKEYKFKLEKLYSKFYTKRGTEIANERKHSAIAFYENLLSEVRSSYINKSKLNEIINP